MVPSSSRDLDVDSRLRRREVVADLARDALVAEDLDRVLDEVVTAASETLACGYCGAFESPPDEDAAVLRAAAGRRSGPEPARVSTDDGTFFEEVLGRDEPVVVDDLAARGHVPDDATESLVDRGLAAAVGVRVGPAEDPWGMVVAAATDPGAFTGADGEFLRRVGEVVASAVEGNATRTESVDAELEEIYGRISDAFLALDEEWRFTYLNERAHDLINPDGRPLVGENVWEAFPEAVGREFEAAYERAMSEQETVSFEEYYPEPLDAWFEVRAYPSETGLSVYFRDVTERKERERELERFEILFEESTDVNAVLDADGTYQYLPPSAEKVLGYEPATLRGESAFDYIHPEDREAVVSEFDRLLENPDHEPTQEFRYRHADGSWIWLESTGRNLLEDPHIQGIVVYARDVTEQVEREQRLERFETIVETVNDGVYVVDVDGYFTMVNEAYAEMLGYPREELVGMHISTIVDNEVLEEVAEMQAEMEAGDVDEPSMEAEVLTASGEPIPAEATFALLPEDDDRWYRVGVVRDIGDRKERERRLAESERRYRTLVENFPNGAVAMFDEDMEYTVAGGQLLDAVGLEASDRVGDSVYDIYPEDIVEEIEPYFRAAFAGETSAFEVEFHDLHLHAHTLPVRNAGGEIFAGMLVVQDVTERREYERELETRARQQQAVAELGQYALEVDDLDELMAEAARRVADVLENDYCKVLDLDPDSRELLLRQGVGWDEGIVGNATVGADENDSQAGYTLRSEEPVVVEDLETETRFSGPALLTSHDVSSGVSTIIGSLDDPWGILGTHDTESRTFTDEDVNFVQSVANILAEAIERHQYQAELEGLVERLEESNERLEQFAYAASHDLQEPLRMVSSYLQLVERRYADQLDDDGEEFIEFAVDGAERMREMIDALLAYSRVETRGDPFEPVDLEAVLADVHDDLQVKIRESDAEITADRLPTVSGDRDQLRQVFQNLLDNAIEYSGDEPPRIHVDAERSGSAAETRGRGGAGEFGDGRWVVSVADEGIGIPRENAETVFEVFQRLHSRGEYAGTGIGLALCERIVERHGGDIWVESEPGEGATFYFTLPAGGADE